MKKRIIAIILTFFIKWIFAQGLTLNTPDKVVFKDVMEGDTIFYNIVLENQSKENIKIKRVKSSCNCTILKFKESDLKPGEKITIPIYINTEGFWGKVLRSVQIYSTDKISPKMTVLFEINVKTEIDFEPRFVDMQNLKIGEKATRKVSIVNNSNYPIIIEQIETDEHSLNLEWESIEIKPGEKTNFTVTIKPQRPLSTYAIIYVHTRNAKKPLYKIPVYINTEE